MNARTNRGGNGVVCDGYYELLGEELTKPLRKCAGDENRLHDFLGNLAAIGLIRQLYMENLMDIRINKFVSAICGELAGSLVDFLWQTFNPYEDWVESKVKGQLSRMWRTVIEPGEVTKGKGKKGTKGKLEKVKEEDDEMDGSGTTSPEEDGEYEAEKMADEEETKMGSIY